MKYYIRQISFLYNDEYLYPAKGFGGIKDMYDTKEEAEAELKKLAQKALSGQMPEQYESISFCHQANNEESKKLDAYLQENFGKPFLVPSDYSDGMMPDRSYGFPQLTEEQAWEIRNLSGIKHYELIEVEETYTFWGIRLGKWTSKEGDWLRGSAMRMVDHQYESQRIPLFFNSEDKAIKAFESVLHYILYNAFDSSSIKGSFEELSDTPSILKSFVENNHSFNYDSDTQTLLVNHPPTDKFVTLNSLLKDKIFEVVPFPEAEVAEIGEGWQPEM